MSTNYSIAKEVISVSIALLHQPYYAKASKGSYNWGFDLSDEISTKSEGHTLLFNLIILKIFNGLPYEAIK